jgi:hypothetical protein
MSNTDSLSDLKFTKHEDLLKKDGPDIGYATMAADFGKAFVQSAAIDPVWNGLGQLVSAGNLPRVSIVNEGNAARSQGDSWAQKFGSAAGIAADFVLLSKGKKALFGGPSTEALASMSWHERAATSAWDGAKLGAFYGAVLTPSDPKENLLWGRVANAGSQALTFGLLNYGSEFLGSAKMFKDLKPGTASYALKDMSVAGLSGMPAGAIGAIADAKLHGRELKLSNVGNAAVDYAVIGFAMAGLNHGIGAFNATDAHGVSNGRKMTDAMGVTRAADISKAEFRIVDGKSDFDSFYRNRLNSSAPAETTVQVQQKQHGIMNGLFGDRFATYGDARPMLISHASDLKLLPGRAGSIGLIATCDTLPTNFRGNDVFPGRSTASDTSVWLQPRGDNKFSLSHADKPLVGDFGGMEPVMLGLPRLPLVDATKIEIGKELDVNPNLKLMRNADGELFAVTSGDTAIWSRVNPGSEVKINPEEPVFSGDKQIDPALLKAASELAVGSKTKIFGTEMTARVLESGLHITAPANGFERIFVRATPGVPIEISPTAKFIHLGPEGTLPITNKQVFVPKPLPEVKDPAKADPAEVPPVVPAKDVEVVDLVAQLNPAKPRPVINEPVEDLGALASRLTGKAIDPKDPAWRLGKFGDVVLDPAVGGIDVGNGTIQILYGDFDSAISAGRFTTGVFKRRLQTDPTDRNTAPNMRVTAEEFQDPAGRHIYIPVIKIDYTAPGAQQGPGGPGGFRPKPVVIKPVGQGRLVLGDNLRPLGLLDGNRLLKIDDQAAKSP